MIGSGREATLVAVVVLAGAGLFAAEVATDEEQLSLVELVVEAAQAMLMVFGVAGVAVLLRRMTAQHREKLALIGELEVARAEGREWRARAQAHVAGLGREIEHQFQRWSLTDAESEVGLLMLKGLSHKEIAALRGTAETTVRQQARGLYQKSGLPGKAAFAAYFLEDLLPPTDFREPMAAVDAAE